LSVNDPTAVWTTLADTVVSCRHHQKEDLVVADQIVWIVKTHLEAVAGCSVAAVAEALVVVMFLSFAGSVVTRTPV
jgi:hypothetical protein